MESIVHFFLHQWQRKLLAIGTALIIWILVNQSINATKTISHVPIRVVNVPANKTIQGLLPSGFLTKQTTLTLTGTKNVVEQLEPGDLEILLDVSNHPENSLVQIAKKNLVSLNPNINLANHITSVAHNELMIKLSPLLTDKIPITIQPPIGTPPEGYDFLDIWPMTLMQTVSGPREQILHLKNKGLELTFNLNEITKEELDALKEIQEGPYKDEVSFYVPESWKKINARLLVNRLEPINDPEAKNLQIDFLCKELIPIKENIPITVFYPLKNSATINPETYPLASNLFVQYHNQISILKVPLFAYHVSRLFLEVIKDNIEINVVAAPKTEREKLEWSVVTIDDTHLEDMYVAFLFSMKGGAGSKTQEREAHFRQRFRFYMQKFALYLANQQPLELDNGLKEQQVVVQVPQASLPASRSSFNYAR